MFLRAIHRRAGLTRLLRLVGIAGVVALVFGAGSVFGAMGSPAPQTFYGCLRVGGLLSNVNTQGPVRCGSLGQPVSWNAEGPVGPSGATGPAGTSGLSHGYVARGASAVYTNTPLGDANLTVATLSGLPAGTYMVTASETAILPSSSNIVSPEPSGVVGCTLEPGGSTGAQGVSVTGVVSVSNQWANVVIPDALTIQAGDSITMTCGGPIGTTSDNAVITAIAVDALN
jgi:hypothetical protein